MDKPLLLVTWHDAEDFSRTWAKEAEATAFAQLPCQVTSCGFLLKKTRTYLCLAADYIGGESQDFGRICKIPRKMIVTIKELPHDVDPRPPTRDRPGLPV